MQTCMFSVGCRYLASLGLQSLHWKDATLACSLVPGGIGPQYTSPNSLSKRQMISQKKTKALGGWRSLGEGQPLKHAGSAQHEQDEEDKVSICKANALAKIT
eukprot:3436923-Amphidinium_carterae.1